MVTACGQLSIATDSLKIRVVCIKEIRYTEKNRMYYS